MMHVYAQYGHIITNYALILAITLVIWTQSQETSNEIGHFVKEIELELKYRMQLIVSYIKHDWKLRYIKELKIKIHGQIK